MVTKICYGGHYPDPQSRNPAIAISGHPNNLSKFENVRMKFNENSKQFHRTVKAGQKRHPTFDTTASFAATPPLI